MSWVWGTKCLFWQETSPPDWHLGCVMDWAPKGRPDGVVQFVEQELSFNIDENSRMASRLRRILAGSGRETLIPQDGDFFALRSAMIVPRRPSVAGGAS